MLVVADELTWCLRTNTSKHGELRRHRVIIKTNRTYLVPYGCTSSPQTPFFFRGKLQFDPKYHIIIRASLIKFVKFIPEKTDANRRIH